MILAHTYDGLGRLSSNKRNKLETNYAYNTRSWLTSTSTGTLFSQRLYYNESYGGNKPLYNGNISAMSWKTSGSSVEKGYKFTYDNLSRLSGAGYLENAAAKTNYTTSYVYDKHGNITKLTRNGNTGTSTHGVIDNLALTYSGNQLTKVEDTAGIPSISTSADFRNGSTATIEYTYDGNGNLTKDLNKGISSIEYNFLNLPGKLVVSNSLGSATNTYVYSADGRKLSVSKGTFKSDYAGHLIYENGVLKRILVDGGYIDMPGKTYHFYLQDHLGNNRVVANQSGSVVQSTQYYPFGMSFADGTGQSVQPYKYNGKELDGDRGVNLYDYHARQMDPVLERFTSVDPLAEKYYSVSPYAYCNNNPMRFVDPTGLSHYSINERGYVGLMKENTDEYDRLFIVDNKGNIINNENYLDVKDKSILSGLSQDRTGYKGRYAITKSSEVGTVFSFVANNTTVEWGLSGFKNGDYVINTDHNEIGVFPATAIVNGYNENNMTFKVHSHPGSDAPIGASQSEALPSDMRSIINMAHRFNNSGNYTSDKFPKHFVYHVESQYLYQYTPYVASIKLGKVTNKSPLFYIINKSRSSLYNP